MRTLAGENSTVYFTHLSTTSCASLQETLGDDGSRSGLAGAYASTAGVTDLMEKHHMPLAKVCLLDPKAEKELSPADSELFEWFLFGVRSTYRTTRMRHFTDCEIFEIFLLPRGY